MRPSKPLPYSDEFASADDYVEQLLYYVSTNATFQILCGGVHIMDFYTTDPGMFYKVVPADWHAFLLDQEPMELLDFLLRDDIDEVAARAAAAEEISDNKRIPPPASLVQYVHDVRRFSLRRTLEEDERRAQPPHPLARKLTTGMSGKKQHEVTRFADYVHRLADTVSAASPTQPVTHLVDVGSGQNYLGRALASPPYQRRVVAVEGRAINVAGAKGLDLLVGVLPAPREEAGAGPGPGPGPMKPMRNKKMYQQMRQQRLPPEKQSEKLRNRMARLALAADARTRESTESEESADSTDNLLNPETAERIRQRPAVPAPDMRPRRVIAAEVYAKHDERNAKRRDAAGNGNADVDGAEADNLIQYVEGRLESGNLAHILEQVQPTRHNGAATPVAPGFLAVSIHSCGNLSHYGLRALVLNPAVRAVAIVGCCYNHLTERLGPPTWKVPGLQQASSPVAQRLPLQQPVNERVVREGERCDPEGFPMSQRMATYVPPDSREGSEVGIRLNITARMMACQAPANWTAAESEAFFSRHFYRAILQRIFVDRGVLRRGRPAEAVDGAHAGDDDNDDDDDDDDDDPAAPATTPIIVGSLRKPCYASLSTYVRGAVAKITEGKGNGAGAAVATADENAGVAARVAHRMAGVTDADLAGYEQRYDARRRRELSAVWTLMAFSAGVAESVIATDRWLFLREAQGVRDCWVESVFSYDLSPRNLVVVGIKGGNGGESEQGAGEPPEGAAATAT